MTQTIQLGNTVSVEYTGKLENGEVFDSSKDRSPLNFKVGSGQLIAGFDNAVVGMAVGESKTVTLPPEEAYGSYSEDLLVSMPMTSVPPDMKLELGMMVQVTDKSGNPVAASVKEILENTVSLDINHPLAGKTLIFEIEIVEIAE